jgi:hypothetical protein
MIVSVCKYCTYCNIYISAKLAQKRKNVRDQKNAAKSNKHEKKISSPMKSSKLNLDDATIQVTQRLQEIDFLLSPSQPITPKDGYCFVHAIIDQLTYDSVWKRAKLTVVS